MSAHQKKVETAKITRDMTQGNPYGHMVAFAMPVLLSQIFQQLYNTADTFIVGKFLGTDALAAVSSSGTLIFLLISFFMGTSMGAGVVISRYFGARDQQDRINQKSASMVKLLKGQIERCEKKLAQQEEDLSSAARMDARPGLQMGVGGRPSCL